MRAGTLLPLASLLGVPQVARAEEREITEFKSVRDAVLPKLTRWVSSGQLPLPGEKLRIVLANAEALTFSVHESVFLNDLKRPEDEVTVVNDRDTLAIQIGRVRWNDPENRGSRRELLVLHELFSVSRLPDSDFKLTYPLAQKADQEWAKRRQDTLEVLKELETYIERNFSAQGMGQTAMAGIMKSLQEIEDYKRCEREGHVKACKKLMKRRKGAMSRFLRDSTQDRMVTSGNKRLRTSLDLAENTGRSEWDQVVKKWTGQARNTYSTSLNQILTQVFDPYENRLVATCAGKGLTVAGMLFCGLQFDAHYFGTWAPQVLNHALSQVHQTFEKIRTEIEADRIPPSL